MHEQPEARIPALSLGIPIHPEVREVVKATGYDWLSGDAGRDQAASAKGSAGGAQDMDSA